MSIDEVKVKAMKEPAFFKQLVSDTENILNSPQLALSEEDKATLYLLIKFGTRAVTAEEYLGIKRGDFDIRGVWVS